MKKIIPFSKDIVFNTDIYEINSISLEHNLKIKGYSIEGDFIVSGDYKTSDSVINNEPFIQNIPFNIEMDSKYILDDIKIEIEDFNYEIVDNNILSVNINVLINELKEKEVEEPEEDDRLIEVIETDNNDDIKEIKEDNVEMPSLINEITFNENNYVNYKVHIFRENDSIDNIIKKYNINKEDIEEYNDLSKVSIGTKIIIPSNE